MLLSSSPTKIPLPFASSASTLYTNPVPTQSQIGIKNGAASFYDGFPPLSFIPLSAGGAGPFGADFNGLLNQITSGLQWLQAGGAVAYDGTFQAAIGGYTSGAIVQSAVQQGVLWGSTVDNNLTNPDTAGAGWVPILPYTYRWDNIINPPSSNVSLRVGDRAAITFNGVTTIPLHIATVTPAFYHINMFCFASNTTDANIVLYPNDTTYTSAFNCWSMNLSDTALTGFGSATALETRTSITSFTNFPGNVSAVPAVTFGPNQVAQNSLVFDLFNGPVNSNNDVGPWILEVLCSTTTVGKMSISGGGIHGGPSIHSGKWADTTTLWTSLGTIVDIHASAMSGLAIVERFG